MKKLISCLRWRYISQSLVCLWFALFMCTAQAKEVEIEKWEVVDIPINATVNAKQLFTVDANAIFSHTSGKKMTVPVFYNGGNEWLIRFSASDIGNWTYKIESKQKSLNGRAGRVKVVQNADTTNHGGVILSSINKQNFYYEDGTPYFVLGYELDWLFALDYENDQGLPKSEHLLSLIKENGFNHIVMNVYSHDVSWDKDPKLASHPEHEFGGKQNIFPFLGSNEKPDHSALNIEFFKKFDRTVQLLHDKRLVAHLMIYVWNKLVSWPEMNSEADNMYFDYIVKRYQAYPNVVWDISKEALYYGRADEAYIKDRIDRLRALNYYQRLVTVHDYKYCTKYPEQVDFISTQDWKHDIYNQMLNVRKKFPNKPIYNIEHGGYEQSPYLVFPGDYVDPEVSVRRNWMILFAGVYTTYYWQGSSWNVIIYNPFEQPENYVKPRFDYFQHMNNFFTQYDFSTFKPAPNKNGSGYTLQNNDDTYLIYVPKGNYQMSRGDWFLQNVKNGVSFENKQTRNYRWFNTLTGEFTEPKTITKGMLFISPWRGQADSILISELVNN
ncbi:DUF5060 domain-containing protein [Colwellia sp. RE-S-Sl-9]